MGFTICPFLLLSDTPLCVTKFVYPFSGRLSYFQLGAIKTKAAMNIFVLIFISLALYVGRELLDFRFML